MKSLLFFRLPVRISDLMTSGIVVAVLPSHHFSMVSTSSHKPFLQWNCCSPSLPERDLLDKAAVSILLAGKKKPKTIKVHIRQKDKPGIPTFYINFTEEKKALKRLHASMHLIGKRGIHNQVNDL